MPLRRICIVELRIPSIINGNLYIQSVIVVDE